LTLRVIAAKRLRLFELRRNGTIAYHGFHLLEEELDWAQGHTTRRMRSATKDQPEIAASLPG
jgi:hypothetical protein